MRGASRKKRSLCWEMGKAGVKAVTALYGALFAVFAAVRWAETGSIHDALADTLTRIIITLPIIAAVIVIILTVASAGRAVEEALG